MFIFNADGLSWLDVHVVMEAGTLLHGDTNAVITQVETLRAGAAVHRQEVRSAALLLGAERPAGQLASLKLVREGLCCRAALCVFIC